MRTDPWTQRRTVPLEVAQAWQQEALAARRAGESTLVELEARDAEIERLRADLANVRRRTDESIARARAAERAAGVQALAEVHDDLVRSLDSNPDPDDPWYQGHRAILGRVQGLIRQAGASPLGLPGEVFDPVVHDAVTTAPGPDGRVLDVHEVGFRLDDGTLVRPARVTVGVGEEAP